MHCHKINLQTPKLTARPLQTNALVGTRYTASAWIARQIYRYTFLSSRCVAMADFEHKSKHTNSIQE
jgi:hypothetical protein